VAHDPCDTEGGETPRAVWPDGSTGAPILAWLVWVRFVVSVSVGVGVCIHVGVAVSVDSFACTLWDLAVPPLGRIAAEGGLSWTT
jgi:hypothetical protein